jgi:hypothetical protein
VTIEDLEDRFRAHPATEHTAPKYQDIRDRCLELAHHIVRATPESRELSLALTNLEQVMFWTNAGIARHPRS